MPLIAWPPLSVRGPWPSGSCSIILPAHEGSWAVLNSDGLAPVAQLDRVTDYESEGQRFESSRAYFQNKRDRESAEINSLASGGTPGGSPALSEGLGCGRRRRSVVKPVNSLLVAAWDEVAVNVHGDLNRVVPHLVFDVGQRLAFPRVFTATCLCHDDPFRNS